MEIRTFELQHLLNAALVDHVGCCTHFRRRSIGSPERSANELLAMSIKEIERMQVCTRRYLDQLRKPIANLSFGQGPQEGEVEKGLHRRMICTQAVFIVAIVDSYLDRH